MMESTKSLLEEFYRKYDHTFLLKVFEKINGVDFSEAIESNENVIDLFYLFSCSKK